MLKNEGVEWPFIIYLFHKQAMNIKLASEGTAGAVQCKWKVNRI